MTMPDRTRERTSYTVAQLLAAHRSFATPHGVENHHAIYSQKALTPELFGPEPPYNAVIALPPRVKRPLSDLTDKPRTLQNTRSRDVAPRPKATPNRPARVEEEVPAPTRSWPANTEEPFLSPGERFGSIDNWQELRRPTLRQQTQASRFTASDAVNHQDWRSARNPGNTPHTAESWERLGQKLRQTGFKPGPDISPAEGSKRTDDSAAQKERALTEVTALLKARYPEELTEELINRLLRGEVAPRQAAPPVPEPVLPAVCKAPATATMSFQQLLQQTSGAAVEPNVDARLSLNDKIVRWSDLRPLFVVQIPKVAISVAKELAAARAAAARSPSRDQMHSVFELYETRVARLYDELKKIRQVTLPEPLEAALKITPETSIALWPTFRELFLQTETMLPQLQQWEAAASSMPAPTGLLHEAPPVQHGVRPVASPTLLNKGSPWKYGKAPSPVVAAAPQPVMFLKVDWEYLDPNQNVQGPFPSQRMYDWWRRDFFPADLPIRQSGRQAFVPLSSLYPPELHAQYSPFRDPWPVTLKDETPPPPDNIPHQRPPPAAAAAHPEIILPKDLHSEDEHQALYASPPHSPRSPKGRLQSNHRKSKVDEPSSHPAGVVYRPSHPSVSNYEAPPHHQPVWARKTTLEDAAAFERAAAVSESEGLGPSLAESRNDTAKAGEAQDGSKTSRKKVKGKKQPLSELLTAQNEQAAAVRSAWASQRATVTQAPMRTGSDDGATVTSNSPPAGAPQYMSPRLDPAERKIIVDAPPLDQLQIKEIGQLCERHKISLDRDFIGLLATMGSVQEMSFFLVDNLGSTAAEVDPFVQDFWDLVKNPFKPVVKGIVASAVTSSRGGKKKQRR